ncbi:MAG: YceI family protein [Bryobacteraceae bacterium]|nr:YceI family protein [Bryobacteraceae bacterium]
MFNIGATRQSLGVLLATFALHAADGPRSFEAANGTVKFIASTNLGAISIHGESKALSGQVQATSSGTQLTVEELEARLDPKSLSTGMSLRDQHMRDKIFAVGQSLPELKFTAAKLQCPPPDAAKESTCQVQGSFSLRGIAKPFAMALKVKQAGQGTYKVSGEGKLKLTSFGIEPPCQLGVCVVDDVQLKLEFLARELQQVSQSNHGKGGAR